MDNQDNLYHRCYYFHLFLCLKGIAVMGEKTVECCLVLHG